MNAAFYNDHDAHCAQWLRNLVAAGHIAPGTVDARDVRELEPEDLDGHQHCHFFAGIGGWAYALQLAGWPADRPVWTGSCPCQPFSTAGRREGHADERHLWPAWARLIRERRPDVVFGEQVASADGLAWLDVVCAELEDIGYAVAAVDFPAAGVGAPHIRQRLWFVAHRHAERCDGLAAPRLHGRWTRPSGDEPAANDADWTRRDDAAGRSPARVADAEREGPQARPTADLPRARWWPEGRQPGQSGLVGAGQFVGVSAGGRCERLGREPAHQQPVQADAHAGFWSSVEWLACRDGRARPTQPGLFPLAHGLPGRVGRLRAYGNAVVPQAAAAVIRAYMDVQHISAASPHDNWSTAC